MKPFKGMIAGKKIVVGHFPEHGKSLGYVINGRWINHPQFGMSIGHTSLVVKKGRWSKRNEYGQRTCDIETLNSRYIWRETQ